MCEHCEEVLRRLDRIERLLSGKALDLDALARHLGCSVRALKQRLLSNRWSWLRAIGQRHSGGGPMRWPVSEVDAGLASQPARTRTRKGK